MDMSRKSSIIWKFFTPKDEITAMCNLCHQRCSYKSSITNLKQHMQRKHSTIRLTSEEAKDDSSTFAVPSTSTHSPEVQRPTLKRTHQSTLVSVITKDGEKRTIQSNQNVSSTPHNLEDTSEEQVDCPSSTPSTSESVAVPSTSARRPTRKRLYQSTINVVARVGFEQKKEIDNKLLQLITKDFQPFSIVDDVGFREYTKALNPSYSLPSRKTVSSTLLPAKYEEVYTKTKEIIKEATAVTITTDCWTSCKNESYIAVTAHYITPDFKPKSLLLETTTLDERHTSTVLANELRRVITEWNLQNKILLVVSDNAANIKKAIKDELKWRHLPCMAHTVNIIVQKALEEVSPLVEKTKSIVSYFKRSTTAKVKLDLYQKQNNKEPKMLVQSVATRWNSVYYMFERMLELKEEVRASLAALGKEDIAMLSNQEFDIINQVVKLLKPLEAVTKILSGERYVTLSSVVIIFNGLHKIYGEFKQDENMLDALPKQVLNKICEGLNDKDQICNIENSDTLIVSTFLDPRYKTVGFKDTNVGDKAKSKVTNYLTSIIELKSTQEKQPETETTSLADEPDESEPNSIWSFFDEKAAQFRPSRTYRSRAIVEVQRYLEEPLLSKSGDPLEWWKTNAYMYPYLSQMVKEKFGTVATSVPCERIFSAAGQIISDRRNRLSSKRVKEILFLNRNW